MTSSLKLSVNKKILLGSVLAITWAATLVLAGSSAIADEGTTMAPPVSSGQGDSASSSVYNWTAVPRDQQIPITRGTFDAGGYQLFTADGDTLVIPFVNQNLYVMKFAVSNTGSMYFVNAGAAPVLYVPQDGYLDNASTPGARWFPFSESFHPADPVFVGIAPSWDEYASMGWYPGMHYYGGYWGADSYFAGGLFVASVGLYFVIGGHRYHDWGHYHDYYRGHPGWRRMDYDHRDRYRDANRHWGGADHHFGGGDHHFGGDDHRGGDDHHFGGDDHHFGGDDHHSGGIGSHSGGIGSHSGGIGSHSSGIGSHSSGIGSHSGGIGSHSGGGGMFGGSGSHSGGGGGMFGGSGSHPGGGGGMFGGSGSHPGGGGGSGGSHSGGGGGSHGGSGKKK